MLAVQHAEFFPVVQPRNRTRPSLLNSNMFDGIQKRAAKLGVELTEERMEVIEFVLDFYENCKERCNARRLMGIMDKEFAEQGGRKYLYRIFPDGPLSQIHDLTGLPDLRGQVDMGFGTSY